MNNIPFLKMSGAGNDFIIIDNREGIVDENRLSGFIQKVCRRKMSAGADGMILVENSESVDFKWRFFNSDGSRAEMCGNGARCVSRFAYLYKIAGREMTFETDAGPVQAQVVGDRSKIQITDPSLPELDFAIKLENGSQEMSRINTGVPHVVIEMDTVEEVAVQSRGREIRFHERFAPAGTNVNFISHLADGHIAVRTYERGVEDETLACGTGAIASALIWSLKKGLDSPVHVTTRSGVQLTIHFQEQGGAFTEVFLEGDARVIYEGQLWEDAWN